jgi:hypothetical protein
MHLKLTQVVSEITGVTGMAILKAILAGERDPQRLAKLRNPHCHHTEDAIAKALQGTWRAEHLCALRQAVELYAFSHQQIAHCDQQIKAHLETLRDQSAGQPLPPKARRHKKTNDPRCDARTPLSRLAGVDLTTIEGIEEGTALVLLSEIGTDMTRWPSVTHCCRWLGWCPQHKSSGGKVLSRRVRPGAHRVTVALRLAARTLHHSQRALGAFFRRMTARLGTPKAITATAHKLARLVYSLLRHGSAYVQQGLDAYEAQYRERKVTTMAKQAKALGYTLVPLAAQGERRHLWPLRSCPSSHSASHAVRRHVSHRRRGQAVLRTPRQPIPPVNRGSPAVATPANMPLTLPQQSLTSRGSSLGGPRRLHRHTYRRNCHRQFLGNAHASPNPCVNVVVPEMPQGLPEPQYSARPRQAESEHGYANRGAVGQASAGSSAPWTGGLGGVATGQRGGHRDVPG